MAGYIERDFKEAYKMMKERALDAEHERDALVKALEEIASGKCPAALAQGIAAEAIRAVVSSPSGGGK